MDDSNSTKSIFYLGNQAGFRSYSELPFFFFCELSIFILNQQLFKFTENITPLLYSSHSTSTKIYELTFQNSSYPNTNDSPFHFSCHIFIFVDQIDQVLIKNYKSLFHYFKKLKITLD